MRKKSNIVDEREIEYEGQKITAKILKPKLKKAHRSFRRVVTNCPNCMSKLILNAGGFWECTGDRLKVWESEFIRYYKANEKEKVETLTKFSDYSRFLELYDRWVYAYQNDKPEEYECGYTNKLFPPNGNVKVHIPDPIFCKKLERKLGRKLTEEELLGESDLYWYNGMVLVKYRKKAKRIKIPYIVLPEEETSYV